jgi:hypothetical protein
MEKVKKAFDAKGITIPYPQRDVHVYQHASQPVSSAALDAILDALPCHKYGTPDDGCPTADPIGQRKSAFGPQYLKILIQNPLTLHGASVYTACQQKKMAGRVWLWLFFFVMICEICEGR